MKEFKEKLIGRLEEKDDDCGCGKIDVWEAISIVNQLAEEYKDKSSIIDDLKAFLKEKFKYNSEQVEIWRDGSDNDSYFRQQKVLYMDRANIYGEVMREIDRLSEEYKVSEMPTGWIPCSERLPENDDEVLCWYEYRIMQGTCEGEMKQTYGIGYYLSYHKTWGGEVSNGRDCRVIAWKPIKPYKEEAEQSLKQIGE